MTNSVPGTTFERELIALQPLLNSYARWSFSQNQEDARDLVQETLLKALRSKDKFIPGTSMKSWLFVIMRNTFLSRMRHERLKDAILPVTTVYQQSQEASVELAQTLSLMRQLPETMQEALHLIGIEQFSYEEAANVAGVEVGTIKSRTARGRNKLAALLNQTSSVRYA